MNQNDPKKKPSLLIYCCSIFLGLIFLVCTTLSILGVVLAPFIYKNVAYSYYVLRGDSNYSLANYQEAISDYTKAIEFKPETSYAYSNRGSVYARQNDYTNAKKDFETAIKLNPTSARAYNQLCWYGSLLGDASNVLSVCEQAVALEPDNPSYRDSRGLALTLTGDYEGAILDFQFFIDHSNESSYITTTEVRKRIKWISELKERNNPFDSEELQELLEDDIFEQNDLPEVEI